MQKGTQRRQETLPRTVYVLLSSGGDMLQGTVPSSHWIILPSTSEVSARVQVHLQAWGCRDTWAFLLRLG